MSDPVSTLIEALNELPEEERRQRAATYLEDLRRYHKKHPKSDDENSESLYEPFQMLIEAELDLPADYSETYEERLYGIRKDEDDD